MSFSYERYGRQQRLNRPTAQHSAALGYWISLGLTVATVTLGFAAWIWNEHSSDDEDDGNDAYEDRQASFRGKQQDRRRDVGKDTTGSDDRIEPRQEYAESSEARTSRNQDSIVTKMSGAIRRTPSPQQIFDGASRRVAASVAAAGAMVGRSLTAIRETDDDFQDHERWSTEANNRSHTVTAPTVLASREHLAEPEKRAQHGGRRKIVAVVISGAETQSTWPEASQAYEIDHASILSHLPQNIDHERVDLVILIYAPDLQNYPIQYSTLPKSKRRPDSSTASSYSNISIPVTDDDSAVEPDTDGLPEVNSLYDTIRASAIRLVSHPTHVLPFTTPTGHVHLLRHLCPSLVYMEESLSGLDGGHIREIENWVGQIIIVIGGHGLADSETEDEGSTDAADKGWWKDSNRVGLGKAEIVDSTRVAEDWAKRIS